jgi:hypothetical protein
MRARRSRPRAWFVAAATLALAVGLPGASPTATAGSAAPLTGARAAAPVVLTGAQLPAWSRLAAVGVAATYPSGSAYGDGVRSAHNGRLLVPPDLRRGVDPDRVAAYRWSATGWQEIAVQVDQRFPYFLANAPSDFSFYSGTDTELTYSFAPDRHATGEEAWKKVFGGCDARYATSLAEVHQAIADGVVTLGLDEPPSAYLAAMGDPVMTFDDDDELVFNAGDAGPPAPLGATPPPGVERGSGQVVRLVDPAAPLTAAAVYLFTRPGGSSFTWESGDVRFERLPDADRWIDRHSFAEGDPEAIGTSNRGYGPNLAGTVCDADGTVRESSDRFPSDAMRVSTPTYQTFASGRWMIREHHVTAPGTTSEYGPDLIDRWKGRAFQQNPDSAISLVGFEDEQVNWEANSALLGWRAGPVRAIREVWGADSGTNVTKTELYYRSADVFRYHLRVHPIPPDGLYTAWDYNLGVAARYYDPLRPEGVPIDGINDDLGNIDALPVPGEPFPAFFDVPDPTFQVPLAIMRPEEVAGHGSAGGLVYVFEMLSPLTSLQHPLVAPYYRDDACLDDGTGDDPVPRPWPGEARHDERVRAGYEAANGVAPGAVLMCDPAAGATPFQGAIGQHGIHFLVTVDSDNLLLPVPINESVGQQWRFSVPMEEPTNVTGAYGANVVVPLVPLVLPFR